MFQLALVQSSKGAALQKKKNGTIARYVYVADTAQYDNFYAN